MARIRCYDCGKLYNYQEDAFCPHCGAFTPPPRATRIASDGTVVRVDGINEAGHAGSFVHREFHEEERERRRTGLDRDVRKRPAAKPSAAKPSMSSAQRSEGSGRRRGASQANGDIMKIIGWIVAGMVILNMLARLVFLF